VSSTVWRSKVGHESLRRTKALHILNGTGESRRQGIYISLKGLIRSQLPALSISDAVSGDTLTIFRPQCPQKQGRQARGPAGCAGVEVRAGHQCPDRKDARPHHAGQAARGSRRGDRMKRREFITLVGDAMELR